MTKPVWTWMEGKTIEGLDGRYIARIWREGERGWGMPAAATFSGYRGRGTWTIEGYGDTPDEAIANLRTKYRGAIADVQ